MVRRCVAIGILAGPMLLSGVMISTAQMSEQPAGARQIGDGISGVWRGNSYCMVKGSPCREEANVYRFAAIEGKQDVFTVTASKIVDGKEVVMGEGEWTLDPPRHALVSVTSGGSLRFIVNGDAMDGMLSLPDGTPYRRILLKKENHEGPNQGKE